MSIGFVIPTLGTRPDWLRLCVRSVLSQDADGLAVAIVTDDTASIEDFADTRLGVVRSNRKGLSRAINDGWNELGRHDFYAWLGDDDLLAPGSLNAATGALSRNQEYSAVFGNLRYINDAGETLFLSRPTRFAGTYARVGKDLIPQPGSVFRAEDGGPPYVDESLTYAMDFDLFLRLQRNAPLLYLNRELASFRLHSGSITGTNTSFIEADSVRRRYMSGSMERVYNLASPMLRQADRLLYKLIQTTADSTSVSQGYPSDWRSA